MSEGPSFLKEKYALHNTPEVAKAAERTEARIREKVPQDPSSRIQNYLDRFKEITDRKDPDTRQRGLEAIKRILYRDYIIDAHSATDQYIKRQKRIAREQGHGDLDVPAALQQQVETASKALLSGTRAEEVLHNFSNEQKQLVEEIVAMVEEQKGSLDQWIEYLASPDAPYPDWLKYWAIRNIVGLSSYDKDKKVFPKRTEKTTNPFPDLNREALAYVLDAINKKREGKSGMAPALAGEDQEQFAKLLASENFAKLYGWAIEKINPPPAELLTVTEGQWVQYPQGSDHLPLTQSIQPHATGWCTAGESVAESQLSRGDFYVYYSLDNQGKPTIPRAAIRMEGQSIAEVRGIAEEQNLDPYIAPIVGEKLKEFPDGKVYEKKAGDMRQLTRIEQKVRAGKELAKDDLIFLYEINAPIEGFGYQKDPRITELRKTRNPKEDALIVLECTPAQIAWSKDEVSENTKAYIGPLFPKVFETLGHLEHLYTAFPEGRIDKRIISTHTELKTPADYKTALTQAGWQVDKWADEILHKAKFGKLKESYECVTLSVKDLGYDQGTTIKDIYAAAKKLGLELCPPQLGPEFRLAYKNQPMNEWRRIAMDAITDSDGNPDVFAVDRSADGSWLGAGSGRPESFCSPDDPVVFVRPRK